MLAVNVDEPFAQILHLLQRDGAVVDEGTAFSTGTHLTTHDAVLLVVVEVVFLEECLQIVFVQVEMSLHDASLGASLHLACVGPVA